MRVIEKILIVVPIDEAGGECWKKHRERLDEDERREQPGLFQAPSSELLPISLSSD